MVCHIFLALLPWLGHVSAYCAVGDFVGGRRLTLARAWEALFASGRTTFSMTTSAFSSNKAGHCLTYKFSCKSGLYIQIPMANHAAAPEPKRMEVLQHIRTLLNQRLRSEIEGLAGPKPSSHHMDIVMNAQGHEYIAPTVCYGMGGTRNFKNAGRWYIVVSIFISFPPFIYPIYLFSSHRRSAQGQSI